MKEKRKFMRLGASLAVTYTTLDGKAVKAIAFLKDISREGLKLSSETALEAGAAIELKIEIPKEEAPVTAVAEVVSVKKISEVSYSMGLRFTEIKSTDRTKLIDYVYSQLVKN